MVEVVVCRHGEDLAWTRNLPRGVALTIYDKTDATAERWPGSVPLPNVGREAQAWLHHLTIRYESLPDWTVFAQGHPFDHAPDFHCFVRNLKEGKHCEGTFHWLGFLWETDNAVGHPSFVNWTKNPERRPLNLEKFFQILWNESCPGAIRYVGGGQFALAAAAARRRTLAFYQRAREVSEQFPDAAHAFERTWDRIFMEPPLPSNLFPPSGYRLLKPVRHPGKAMRRD